MFDNNLKKLIKKFPILWNFLRRFKDNLIILSRYKDVLMMMILFHLWPEQTYRFSTRRSLPKKKNRYSKNAKPLIPYDLIKSKSCKIPRMKEISAVGRGLSFDLNYIKNLKGPIFFMSFRVPLKIDSNGNIIYTYENLEAKAMSGVKHSYNINNSNNLKIFKKKNVTYICPRYQYAKPLIKKGYDVLIIHNYYLDKNEKPFPASKIWKTASYLSLFNNNNCKRISLIEKVYRPPIEKTVKSLTAGVPPQASTPVYSFIEQICGLSFFAKKVNVYGWDFYLTSSPKKMGYWQLFFNMYKFKLDARARNHFEAALINFYYGYHLSKLPNFNIRGYMAQLGKHKKLIRRIERVLFN